MSSSGPKWTFTKICIYGPGFKWLDCSNLHLWFCMVPSGVLLKFAFMVLIPSGVMRKFALMVLVPSGLVLKFAFMVLVSSDSAQICIYGSGPKWSSAQICIYGPFGSTLLYGNINCASNISSQLVKTTCKYDN